MLWSKHHRDPTKHQLLRSLMISSSASVCWYNISECQFLLQSSQIKTWVVMWSWYLTILSFIVKSWYRCIPPCKTAWNVSSHNYNGDVRWPDAPFDRMSLLLVCLYLVYERHAGRHPHIRSLLWTRPLSLWHASPIHRMRRSLSITDMLLDVVLVKTLYLVTLASHVMPKILGRHLIW